MNENEYGILLWKVEKQALLEQVEALKQRVPVRVGGDNMDLAAGWTAAIEAVVGVFKDTRA